MVLEFALELLYILSLFSQKRFAGWSPAALMLAAHGSTRPRQHTPAYGSRKVSSRNDLYQLLENSFQEEDVYKLLQKRQPHLYYRARCTSAEQLQAEGICTSSQRTASRRSTSSRRTATRRTASRKTV